MIFVLLISRLSRPTTSNGLLVYLKAGRDGRDACQGSRGNGLRILTLPHFPPAPGFKAFHWADIPTPRFHGTESKTRMNARPPEATASGVYSAGPQGSMGPG